MQALVNARVLLDQGFVEDKAVLIDGSKIKRHRPDRSGSSGSVAGRSRGGPCWCPALSILRSTEAAASCSNDAPSVRTIRTIASAHARFGTTGMLPTLITDELDVIRAAIAAVDAAIEQDVPGILGIHIEGPFINTKRKGIHAADQIRALDAEGLAVLTSLRRGSTLVTLAPEMVDPAMIAELVAAGVIVAAGHTAATYQEVNRALDAGVSGFTHLFNAMSPLTSREPGVVGAALESDSSWCAMIVDGHHVSPATLRLALRCKPADRVMLVTDAMPDHRRRSDELHAAGPTDQSRRRAPGGRRRYIGGLRPGHGDSCAATRIRCLGVSLEQAFAMASRIPASFLGLGSSLGRIAPGYSASLTVIDDTLTTVAAYANGERIA